MTATNFAREMGISYPTVIRWLDRQLVPGAELKESPERGKWWEIPETALEMERPTPGPKKGSKRTATKSEGEASTVINASDDDQLSAITKKPTKKANKTKR